MIKLSHLLLATTLAVVAPWVSAEEHGDAAALQSALDASSRPGTDKARDPGRKPAEVLTFLGFEEGMRVMDMIAAGGYYTEVLSVAVGEHGTVYAQNPPAVLKFRDGANDKTLTERLANDRLANVIRLDADFAEIDLEPGSLDGAITALNFHDVYHRSPEAAVAMLEKVYSLLEPGGTLGIIDHTGIADQDNAALHRIERENVIAAAGKAGFELEAASELLVNPEDTHTKMVFDPEIRGNTDRFLLRFRKPA